MKEDGWIAYYKQQIQLYLADRKDKRSSLLKPKAGLRPRSAPPPPKATSVLPDNYRIIKNLGKYIAQVGAKHGSGWSSIGTSNLFEWGDDPQYSKYCFNSTIAKAIAVAERHVASKLVEVIEVV